MTLRPTSVGTLAVTGAASGLGRALVERLAGADDLDALIGIDVGGARIDGVVWRTSDVRDPLLASRLAGVDTLVHLATSYDTGADPVARRALNVRGTALVLDGAAAAQVRHVVLVTSLEVLAADPANPVPLPDRTPPRAPEDDSLVGEMVAVERLAAAGRGRGRPRVTVLRPATLVAGPLGRSYEGARLQLLAAPRLLAARGVEPLWQLCHADDLVTALELAVRGRVTGVVPVACDGWLTQRAVEAISGRRRLELPPAVAVGAAERVHRLAGGTGWPHELDHLIGPVVTGCSTLHAAGWSPVWTNEGALRSHLAGRSSTEGWTGSYTVAGATVAVVGTAALVRRARRRRGR